MPDFHRFSTHVASTLVARELGTGQDDDGTSWSQGFIFATCAYTPRYFYESIRDAWEKDGSEEAVSGLEALQEFEECVRRRELDLVADVPLHFSPVKAQFISFAKRKFPHFFALHQCQDRMVRICLFGRDLPNVNQYTTRGQFIEDFFTAHGHNAAAAYAFFHWLNGPIPAFVASPDNWRAWGLTYPRDFAIVNDYKVLVEYHRDEQMYIQVDPFSPGDWPFCDFFTMVEKAKKREWQELTPWHVFLVEVFGSYEKQRQHVLGLVSQLRADVVASQTQYTEDRVAELLDILNRVAEAVAMAPKTASMTRLISALEESDLNEHKALWCSRVDGALMDMLT